MKSLNASGNQAKCQHQDNSRKQQDGTQKRSLCRRVCLSRHSVMVRKVQDPSDRREQKAPKSKHRIGSVDFLDPLAAPRTLSIVDMNTCATFHTIFACLITKLHGQTSQKMYIKSTTIHFQFIVPHFFLFVKSLFSISYGYFVSFSFGAEPLPNSVLYWSKNTFFSATLQDFLLTIPTFNDKIKNIT